MDNFSEKRAWVRHDLGIAPQTSLRKFGCTSESGNAHGGADYALLEAVYDAIANGKPSPYSLKRGLAITLPGIFAAESARNGGELVKIRYPWS